MSRLLIECGEALYGQQWQSALARDLGVSDRTVRRWAAGGKVPQGVYADLLWVCADHVARIETMAVRLKNTNVA